MSINTKITMMKNEQWSIPFSSNCTQVIHPITSAILDDPFVLQFASGLFVQSASLGHTKHSPGIPKVEGKYRHYANIERGASIGIDGGCNVVNNGMRDVHLLYLRLNNGPCVEDALGGDLNDALQRFGPDQLGLVRITQIFEVDPTNFDMQWVLLDTYEPYRSKYPGRALVSCDALKATKYPPDPISWCFFLLLLLYGIKLTHSSMKISKAHFLIIWRMFTMVPLRLIPNHTLMWMKSRLLFHAPKAIKQQLMRNAIGSRMVPWLITACSMLAAPRKITASFHTFLTRRL